MEHLIASAFLLQLKLNFLPEDARRWKGRLWNVSRKLHLNVILKLICQQLMLHNCRMTMIFSALWIQQEERQQYSVARHGINVNQLTVSQGLPTSFIARVFVKANYTMPSSAAVEHPFSIAGMILSPRHCKLSDRLFDKKVFLKCRANCCL